MVNDLSGLRKLKPKLWVEKLDNSSVYKTEFSITSYNSVLQIFTQRASYQFIAYGIQIRLQHLLCDKGVSTHWLSLTMGAMLNLCQ